ncbi:CocE/NonD family hydrolase [Novosphingobium piscinae]|uniref:CocE/NonD family hydrolase n=1 Tax=Novosphingobium piscinae TaxID=1507448 RepID=A0A7X1KNL6_9SPHN|nr:CocE/NonD family hydrolase [Novosphingobium piscinae]MBC2667573.1 CocE/NonD family hydrolase [Novosphingobium piscinae]
MRWLAAGLAAALAVAGTGVAGQAVPVPPPTLTPAEVPASFGHYQPPRRYHEQVTHSFYVTLRDGTRVAMLVARPAQGGQPVEDRFPVIWHHSLSATQQPADGVGSRAAGFVTMPNLTDHGYVVVQVARRGNGQSFGTMRGYHDRNEAHDAYELIEWLARQPWSNGNVGQYGCSNTGDAAAHAMSVNAPHLKAVFAGCFSWNKYDAMRRGGIFAQWGTGPTRTIAQDMAVRPVDSDPDKVLLRLAAEQHQRAVPLFEVWKALPYRDSFSPQLQSPFWAEGSASSYRPQMVQGGVPLYVVGGWRDELRDQGLIAQANIPGARILIGDWLHCENDGFALVEEAHRFFDRHLKGIDTGIDRDDPIHYVVVGPNAWRSSKVWPLPDARPTPFALTARGLVEGVFTGAALRRDFAVDYAVNCEKSGFGPTMQPCHNPGNGWSIAGPPLTAAAEYTGHGVADLWIAADTPDANLFLYVEDVAPDGTVRVITEGRLKASLRRTAEAPWILPGGYPWHRAFAEDAQPLQPGQPARLQFDLMPTSWTFQPGHRVQLTLAGSDWRERARDPQAQPRTITILSDRDHPSSVVLPLIRQGGSGAGRPVATLRRAQPVTAADQSARVTR